MRSTQGALQRTAVVAGLVLVKGRRMAALEQAETASVLTARASIGFVHRPVVTGRGLAPMNPSGGRSFGGGSL